MNNKTKALIGIGAVAIVAIALIVIFVGGSNGTKLTLSNYSDFLDIDPQIALTTKLEIEGYSAWLGHYSGRYPHITTDFYSKLEPRMYSENLAPNYSYSDVNVTIRYTVTAYVLPATWKNNTDIIAPLTPVTFDFERTYLLTAGGTPKDTSGELADLPNGKILPMWYESYFGKVENANYDYEAEIIEISGKVITK